METTTQALHRLTVLDHDGLKGRGDSRLRRNFTPSDWSRLPWFFKRYPDSLPRVGLARELPSTSVPALAVLAGTAEAGPTELDLGQLSRLLHLSAGVVRTAEWPPGKTWPFRAAGSAGGRFPLEVYVAVPDGVAVPAGVYWYDPPEHALVQIGPTPRGVTPAVVVTGIPWRTGWKYAERGYRHVYWDAGTMLAQFLAAADSARVGGSLYTRFPDTAVAALVGADGLHEWPVAVVALGDGRPAIEATGSAAAGAVDADPLEFQLATAAQRAGDCDVLGAPWTRGAPVDVPDEPQEPLDVVVYARSSQRRMNPSRGLTESVLRTSMRVALRGVALTHRVVVHDVDGLAPGLYRWPDLSAPVRAGVMRDELYRVTTGQALARDAAFVVIGAAAVGELDDREYREAQLSAGLVEGRLHLAAYALGASASGMTFADGDVRALLGEPLDALLFTCVGVPEYEPVRGGPPGAPTAIRMVRSRT